MKRLLCTALALSLFGCSAEQPTSPDLDVSFARGSKPTTGTLITATRLDSKQQGCSSSSAEAINDVSIATAGGYCGRNGQLNLLLWNELSGASNFAQEGTVRDVSNSGSAYGISNFAPFVRPAGGSIMYLPLLPGSSSGELYAAAANDSRVVGGSEFVTGNSSVMHAVLWTNSGGTWTVEQFTGYPQALTDDGTMIVGSSGSHVALWRFDGGSWVMQSLPDGGAVSSVANSVNQTGTVIAGVRYIPLPSDPSQTYEEHVAWISDGSGGWTMKILGGLNIREGTAMGVADQTDGSTLVVGRSWEDTSGPGGQLWAVAWRKPSGSTEFDPPVRLQPLSKGSDAGASDVNSFGQIVGYSYSRSAAYAVIWQFPH